MRIYSECVNTSSTTKYLGWLLIPRCPWMCILQIRNLLADGLLWQQLTTIGLLGAKWYIRHWLYLCFNSLLAWATIHSSREGSHKYVKACMPLYHWGIPAYLLSPLSLSLFILKEARMAAYRMKINNNWRWNLCRVGYSLIIVEVLMVCRVLLHSPLHSNDLILSRIWRVIRLERAGSWMMWYTDGSQIGLRSGFEV